MEPMLALAFDSYILAFSSLTVVVTIWMGFRAAKTSKTASDFFVAGRSVSVGWNASAISGEYLSAASFMGIAGMVMSSGYDALWYPVCYACGYLFLLLFIAGPLRRFGAYTIPDFAEGRFDSPLFRKIAVCFVLFIGFFYTMPQMKGAGTTLAYIFPGLPYWAGVVLVGAVITLNVALGGMKGITLVQAFQYWVKMFAISVPIFVLMAVYGHYGKQLGANGGNVQHPVSNVQRSTNGTNAALEVGSSKLSVERSVLPLTGLEVQKHPDFQKSFISFALNSERKIEQIVPALASDATVKEKADVVADWLTDAPQVDGMKTRTTLQTIGAYNAAIRRTVWVAISLTNSWMQNARTNPSFGVKQTRQQAELALEKFLNEAGIGLARLAGDEVAAIPNSEAAQYAKLFAAWNSATIVRKPLPEKAPKDETWLSPFGPLTTKAAKAAKLSPEEAKPYSLLYTYSLIIALICGTAGLPHILVRFYTNPDGGAAKRTTMWVMILIGIFYVFPPVFGVMGRNLFPELYSGIGAKGTDKIVLELPRLLNDKYAPLGSILSGITCAGAFAAFMSTFSGLLVSMTGAMAHDVYGRMLRPKSTPEQRMKMFKLFAIVIGAVAMLLGSFVEALEINFMVGQAFAIAAASYFPLLFMAVWWRKLTMKGAATGMLTGGLSAVAAISLTSFSTLAAAPGQAGELFAVFKPLNDFWAHHPLLRILCEQPAIWAVPLAIGLMIVISKLTQKDVPADIRMKMLVLHAPEKLGLKQEYIQEHQPGAH
ncbi:MAG TPA: cation acetate symporter [Verrucomicrobiae bacterium]|nr:cation acetate symporter [Verrucomicrobiae bacterium]